MAIEFNPKSKEVKKASVSVPTNSRLEQPDVKKVFPETDPNKAVKVLTDSVNIKELKKGFKNGDGTALALMFGQIGYNDQTKSDSIRAQALEKVLDKAFGLVASKEQSVTNTYVLGDGTIIIYNRGENITFQTKDGKTQSFDLEGNLMPKTPNIDFAMINFTKDEIASMQQ